MKFKYFIIFSFLLSCAGSNFTKKSIIPYNAKGFALIFNENDYQDKIVSIRLKNDKPYASTNMINAGKTLRLTNPEIKKQLKLKLQKIKISSFLQNSYKRKYSRSTFA